MEKTILKVQTREASGKRIAKDLRNKQMIPAIVYKGGKDSLKLQVTETDLDMALHTGAGENVILTLKPHGGLNATGPECRKIIEKVDHPNFQLWYDPGNIFYYSGGYLNPTKDVDSVDDIIKGMCVKDFKPPKQVVLTPGTGDVDFPILFAKLKMSGFTAGPLVIECLDEGDLDSKLEQAQKAKSYLEKMLA